MPEKDPIKEFLQIQGIPNTLEQIKELNEQQKPAGPGYGALKIAQRRSPDIRTQRNIINSVFGPKEEKEAEHPLLTSYREMLDKVKASTEKRKTDAVKMAKFNALGNALTTMVQPLGWAIGGSTAPVQPVDNRQYLDAFTRAQKANEELSHLDTMEDEFQFKLAEDEYQREKAWEDYTKKRDYADAADLEKQQKIFDMRSKLNAEQIEGRIKVAEAQARAKYKFSANGKRVAESVRDNLLKRANAAYSQILSDYYKKSALGIVIAEPPTYDEFLERFASENGYQVAAQQNAKEEKKDGGEDFSGYKRGGNGGGGTSSSSGEDFSSYKRN